jgi:bacterioferritin-associated ferredoxin
MFHVEAIRKNYRRAAQDARRGKRLLEEALAADPGLEDPLFALGAYNYYASRIPALARGLAAFLGLPGGDRDTGLAQLRRVADSRSRFRTSGRLLLASICGSREECCYREAGRLLDAALAESPGSPLILGSRGDLELRLGGYETAARLFAEALDAAAGPGPDRERQRRELRILRAEALVAAWRPEEAGAVLAALPADHAALTPGQRRDLSRLEEERTARAAAAESREALRLERDGRAAEAAAFMAKAVAARPADPLARWVLGGLLLRSGRAREAVAELEAAAGGGEPLPAWLDGEIELDRGLAERALGRARAARSHFKRAAEIKRFRAADRALRELARDGGIGGDCGACAVSDRAAGAP